MKGDDTTLMIGKILNIIKLNIIKVVYLLSACAKERSFFLKSFSNSKSSLSVMAYSLLKQSSMQPHRGS